jgi:hypothetical protein
MITYCTACHAFEALSDSDVCWYCYELDEHNRWRIEQDTLQRFNNDGGYGGDHVGE